MRTMLGHAVKDKPEEIPKVVEKIGDERFRECIGLCVCIAGYITVDVLGPEWPTEAGLRQMAKGAARSETTYELDESQIYDFLRKSAIGFQTLDHVFSAREEMVIMPILMTASLMLTYCPREKGIWEYLDEIEAALEAADSVKQSFYPAMILFAHRLEAKKAK